jgi:CheY-like chemotaxis protein
MKEPYMDILVVEDNFLASEMIRLAVEDANFNVIGPASSVDEGMRLASGAELDGALLDINVGGCQAYPLARLLQSRGVPFIFVTGYDRTVLPKDMQTAPLVSKPVFMQELTRLAIDGFLETKRSPIETIGPDTAATRVAQMKARIEKGVQRLANQKRRVERLQVSGADPYVAKLAADLYEQMDLSLELMTTALLSLERADKPTVGSMVRQAISDGTIDPLDGKSVAYWATHFSLGSAELLDLAEKHGWSARLIKKSLGRPSTAGPVRKSKA